MQEQAIRTKIREKLQSEQLPRELWPKGNPPDASIEVHTARGEACSACDEPIHPSEPISDMVTHQHPNRVFVFHGSCEELWRDESSRFVRPQEDLPPN
jgi:hypothetical protein